MDTELMPPQPEHRSNQPNSGGGGTSLSSSQVPGVGASPDRDTFRNLGVHIDKVANTMRLSNKYRAELHQCKEVR